MGDHKRYGVPFYGASFVPPNALNNHDDDEAPPSIQTGNYVLLSGGGGEGHSGIPNALVISRFDLASNSLSDEPVAKIRTADDLPYRMAVHPGGEGIICSFPNSCGLFTWERVNDSPSVRPSARALVQLEDIGQQLVLRFNNDGSLLAIGGEDGKLRVFKWPSMDNILDEAKAYQRVKDLDFSPDGKFLVSVGRGGPGRVWDITSSTPVASLPNENDEDFGFCRFSQTSGDNQVLYITVMKDNGASIAKYNTVSWKRVSLKKIIKNPFSAFTVSPDGNLIAVGTIEGDILVLNSMSMRTRTAIKKSHLGLVTSMAFSEDSRALVSVSMDASVRVTVITDEKKKGTSMWIILLIMILIIAITLSSDKRQWILHKLMPCCH
jgi:prolactin regulatory element-binding protein